MFLLSAAYVSLHTTIYTYWTVINHARLTDAHIVASRFDAWFVPSRRDWFPTSERIQLTPEVAGLDNVYISFCIRFDKLIGFTPSSDLK